MNREMLLSYGIDYDKGMKSCMDNEAFYKRILSMFLRDDCFPRAKAARACGDYRELFNCMHELKGVSGNAALTGLFAAVAPLVELLRLDKSGDGTDDEANRLFAAVETSYRRTCEGIARALAES